MPRMKREGTKRFAQIILEMEDGEFHDDLSEDVRDLLAQISQAAGDSGKGKGELHIKLKFSMKKGGNVELNTETSIKAPKPVRKPSIFWLDRNNNLSTENPKQVVMEEVRTLPRMRQEVRDAVAVPGD